MADVTVTIPRLLADVSGGVRTFDVQATTAAEAIEELCRLVPELRVHVFDDTGEVRRHVNVFVRGTHTPAADLVTEVTDGDEVAVIQAVSGG